MTQAPSPCVVFNEACGGTFNGAPKGCSNEARQVRDRWVPFGRASWGGLQVLCTALRLGWSVQDRAVHGGQVQNGQQRWLSQSFPSLTGERLSGNYTPR